MAVDEQRRKRLHDALERAHGAEEAATMMELVPPVGWADVATKRDLDQLEARLDARFEARLLREMNEQTRTFSERIDRLFRSFVVANLGTVLTVAALAFGAARLA